MKIALVCATPAGSNCGMISVDLAFETIKRHFNSDVKVYRYCAWRSINKNEHLQYIELKDVSQLEDADKIIFWGDFLHWIKYGCNDWKNKFLQKYSELDEDSILDLWYKLCLLEHRSDLQRKTIIFGNTIYGLDSSQLLNLRYKTALTELYSNSQAIMFRDILSMNFCSQITNQQAKVSPGCDCALLYNSTQIKNKNLSDNYFTYSFARSGKNDLLMRLVNDLAIDLNLTPIYVPWIKKGATIDLLSNNLSIIKHSKFILTDIYHCAINSYRENTKVICFGNASNVITDTLSDKKKELFHFQHFASLNYRYTENLTHSYESEINLIKQLVNNDEYYNNIFNLLQMHVNNVRKKLIEEILR